MNGAFIAFLAISSMASASGDALSLDDCYRLALSRSDTIASQVELINQAESRVVQSRTAFLPSIAFSYLLIEQDQPGNPLARNFFPAEQKTAKFSADQNIFNGFRSFAAIKQRTAEKGSTESALDSARRLLFEDTAQSFFDVLAYEADIENFRSEISANQDRREELIGLRKLARARQADIISTESSIANLEALAASVKGLLQSSRETLAFLTGMPPDTPLRDNDPPVGPIAPAEVWTAHANQRPEVIRAEKDLSAASAAVAVARGAQFPSADLGANYYLTRPGVTSDIHWDAQIGISLPLFTGGLIRAQISESLSKRRQMELVMENERRLAETDIRSRFQIASAALDQVSKYQKAAELSFQNYELRLKDSRKGLATHVDVLQALASAFQIKRSSDRARFTFKQQRALLEAASGRRDLNPKRTTVTP